VRDTRTCSGCCFRRKRPRECRSARSRAPERESRFDRGDLRGRGLEIAGANLGWQPISRLQSPKDVVLPIDLCRSGGCIVWPSFETNRQRKDCTVTDFGQMKNYANYINADPFRRALHFPAVEAVLGDLNNKRILDIGCGDGLFPRLLAERGASVVGYDKASEKIAEAWAHKDARQLDVSFVVATPHTFLHDGAFDAAISVMVLQFATSPEELAAFFRSASRHLGSGGRFTSVVINPLFSAFGQDFVVRRFTKLDGNKVRSEFVDRSSGRVEMTVELHQYTCIRAGTGHRRNEPRGMDETLCHTGCCSTNWRLLLAAVS